MGLVSPWHVESSQTRDRTRVLCIGKQILNHQGSPQLSSYIMDRSPVATWTKCQERGGWKPQKCILFWFRRSEVQGQGVGRALLLLRALGENPASPVELLVLVGSPWCSLACGCFSSVSASDAWPSPLPVCVCLYVLSFSYKEEEMDWGPTLPSYDLIVTDHICQGWISK